jgi:glyoxylase-like metal-dependent hydrolase (beta-lactamase superfamily II)
MVTVLKDVPVAGIEVIPCRLNGPRGIVKSFLLHDSESMILIDSGRTEEDSDIIRERIQRIGRTVDDLTAVVVTHRHSDHVGGLEGLRRHARFPILSHPAEGDAIQDLTGLRPDRHVEDGDHLDPLGVEVIHMPGHTPGSIALYWPRHGALFAGDAIVSAGEHLMVSPAFLCMDPDQARDSVRRLLEMPMDIDMVLVAHGEDVYSNTAQPLGRILDEHRKS